MITARISAGSSSIVQDIIDMCLAIHPTLSDWQGWIYNASTTGDKPWCIWAQRMDEDAHELQYVSSSGLANPPDAYEKITVTCPSVTGFALSFTAVNAMPSVLQTGKGESGGKGASSSLPIYNIRMSAAGSSALTDYINMCTSTIGSSSISHRYFYISTHGSQPWACYAWYANFGGSSVNPCLITIGMSGFASPPAGSEALAIAAPSATTLTTNGFTQVTGPLAINFQP